MKIRHAGIFTKIVLLVLLVYAVASLVTLRTKVETAKVNEAALQQQVDDKTASNEQMRYAVENKDDPEVIEGVARDKLGLVQQDEEVYKAG